MRQTGRRFTFKDLIDQIQDWMNILSNRGINERRGNNNNAKSNNSNGRQTANVNASSSRAPTKTTSQGYAGKAGNSPVQKQSTERCGMCESVHATESCHTLANLNPDERINKLRTKGCCFYCLKRGHKASECEEPRPICTTCRKPGHNSILHRQRPVNRQRPDSSTLPFQPMTPGQSATTNVAATTSSAPPPHGPPVQPSAPVAPSAPTDPASI